MSTLMRRVTPYPGTRLFLILPATALLIVCVSGADQNTSSAGKPAASPPAREEATDAKPDTTKHSATNENEAAIRAGADAFVKAFNASDARAIANLWTPNGTVADEDGHLFKGHKAIEEEYATLFKAHPTARMELAIRSIEFPTPTTAIEDGVGQVLTKDNAPPSASRYTAVHVREKGQWLLASVRESPFPVASNFAQLRELGWLVGNWQAKPSGATAQSRIRWIANKSFLQRDFSVHRDGLLVSSGTQIVGWDPRAGQIVSWTFDSSGGHGMGRWTGAPDGWRIESAGMTPDGLPTSSNDHLIRVPGEDNVFGWRSADRKLGDTKLPDVGEVVFDRTETASPRQ